MPAKRPYSAPPKVTRGRRTTAEKDSRRWRLSIKEATETKDGYSWTTYIVQGWQEGSRWQRKRFKSRAEAEAFKSSKEIELIPTDDVQRVIITGLSQARVNEAGMAYALLDAQPMLTGTDGLTVTPSLLTAVQEYLDRLKAAHVVQRVSMLDALQACVTDKMARNKLRERSSVQLKSSVKLFTAWLTRLPRFTAESLDPQWSPAVCDITAADLLAYLQSMRGKEGRPAVGKTWDNTRGDVGGFFQWCMGREGRVPIPGCSRRWILQNPAHDVPTSNGDDGEHAPSVLSADAAAEFMAMLERDFPAMVPLYAIALFAGIRPSRDGELFKLAKHPGLATPCKEAAGRPLIDLERGTIKITPAMAKTRKARIITIRPNLNTWLTRYGVNLLPVGWATFNVAIRKAFKLEHDVLRHSYISYLVPIIGKALTAAQAGNSETIIDKHYLNLPSEAEAAAFWQIMPSGKA